MSLLSILSIYNPQQIKILTWFHSFFSSPPLHNCKRYLVVGLLYTNVLKEVVKCYCLQWDILLFESNGSIDFGALDSCNIWYKLYKTFPLSVVIYFTHQTWVTGSTRMCHWSKPILSVPHTVHDIHFLPVFIKKYTRRKKTVIFSHSFPAFYISDSNIQWSTYMSKHWY